MKQLPRRLFLKAMAAAPAVAQRIAEEAVGAHVATAVGGDMIGHGVPMPFHGGHSKMMELAALNKAGLLPDWVKRQASRNARQFGRRIDPDVAAMQSVSLSAKLRISEDRSLRRELDNLENNAIESKLMAEFMGWHQ